jgi:hypothetical protein
MSTTTQERTARDFDDVTLLSSGDAAVSASQRAIGDVTELSINAAKENARLVAEVQMAALDVLRESHAAVLRWQTLLKTSFPSPPASRAHPVLHHWHNRRLGSEDGNRLDHDADHARLG